MSPINVSSPRIASASFLAMCAVAGLPSPAPTTPTTNVLGIPTEWLSQTASPVLPPLSFTQLEGSLFSRRALVNEADTLGLGLGLNCLKPSSAVISVDGPPTIPEFAFFSRDTHGKMTPMFENIPFALSGSDDTKRPRVTLKPCLKRTRNGAQTSSTLDNRRVTFSDQVRIHYLPPNPPELEDEPIPVAAMERLSSSMLKNHVRTIPPNRKSFGPLARGRPSTMKPLGGAQAQVLPDNVSHYRNFTVQAEPQIRTYTFASAQASDGGKQKDHGNYPSHLLPSEVTQATRDLAKTKIPASLTNTKPLDKVSPMNSSTTNESVERSRHRLLTLEAFSQTLF